MTITERINALRQLMKDKKTDAYIIPTSDFHQSEYVSGYFKCREYMSGFTGSAGTLIITKDKAGLWTDGRYFVQAEKQLMGTGITLYRMGDDGVPGIYDFLLEELPGKGALGFDGRVISAKAGEEFERLAEVKKCSLLYDDDLVDYVWKERPALEHKEVFLLDDEIAGESRKDKIARIQKALVEDDIYEHIVTSLDDIAWILNIRGCDVSYNPVVLSYLSISQDGCVFFVQEDALNENIKNIFCSEEIEIKSYNSFFDYVKTISNSVLADKSKISYAVLKTLANATITDGSNLSTQMKAVKNAAEISGMRDAHIKDGLAVTRFMHWLKINIGKTAITEISAAKRLEEFRKESADYMLPSFETISAYGSNGAIVHYAPTNESNKTLEPESFLLVDSGGHYTNGTTDITRTFVLGELTKKQKLHYTAVVKGMLALADAKFKYGCSGLNLDYMARRYLWSMGLDYNHGTGHGVGFILNVHEGPNAFRWREPSGKGAVLEPGMITSDEPGIYITNEYGIRIENLILCVEKEKNEYGRFLGFEHLTMVPIDLDAIDLSSMEREDIERINNYHRQVYSSLSPYMSREERAWLKEYTREL